MTAQRGPRPFAVTAAGGIGAALLVAGVAVAVVGTTGSDVPYLDLSIYQEAVRIWWGGGSPYGVGIVDGLVFYYPPSALVLLAPLAPLPTAAAGALLALLGAVALVTSTSAAAGPRTVAALAICGLAALSEPVQATWRYGQVNLVVIGLSVAGLVTAGGPALDRPRLRGAAVGAAAALKLQPLALLVVPALARRWTVVVSALATAIGLVALAALRSPGVVGDWLAQVAGGAVDGRPQDAARNASWRGLLDALVGGSAARGVWVVLALLVLAAAAAGVVRAVRAGRTAVAVSIVALAVLLAWPVSWTHHWAWIPFVAASALAPVGVRALDRLVLVPAALLGAAALLWLPAWFATDDHALGTAGLTWLASYSYVLLGTLTLAALVLREVRTPAGRATAPTS